MKRNLNLLKEILVEIEAAPTFDRSLNIQIPEFNYDEIEYHIKLLEEAQLIKVLGGGKGIVTRIPSPNEKNIIDLRTFLDGYFSLMALD